MPHGFFNVSPAEYARAVELAGETLGLARNTLLIRLRFLDAAINRLQTAVHAEIAFASDGNCLYYEPFSLLKRYKAEPGAMNRDLLHILLHSLLRHPWFHTDRDRAVWDLACDVAVEVIAAELGFPAERDEWQRPILAQLRREVRPLTAEKIYRYYLKKNLSSGQLREERKHFRVDDHGLWYQEGGFNPAGGGDDAWAQIARRAQTDLQTFSRGRGEGAGALVQFWIGAGEYDSLQRGERMEECLIFLSSDTIFSVGEKENVCWYIRENRDAVISKILEENLIAALRGFLDNYHNTLPGDFAILQTDEYRQQILLDLTAELIERTDEAGRHELTAWLLEYRKNTFPDAFVEEVEQDRLDK